MNRKGQLVTLAPTKPEEVQAGDVVFVRWKGNFLLRIVKKVTDSEVLTGNNLGKTNGWVLSQDVIGTVTGIEA